MALLRDLGRRAAAPGITDAEVFALDFDLYIALTAAARNRVLGLLVNTVREAIKAYTGILMHVIVTPGVVRAHHQQLIAAIEARRPADAVAAVEEYMQAGSQHVLRLVDEGQLGMLHG